MRLHLRGFLAILALTFLSPLPAVADPSDLGITVAEILQVIEDSGEPSVPLKVEQKDGALEVRIGQSNLIVRISVAGKFEDVRSAVAKSVWLVAALTVTGPDYSSEQAAIDRNVADAVFRQVWSRLTGVVDIEEWAMRRVAERGGFKEGSFPGFSYILNGNRVAVYVGVPTVFVFDTFVNCTLDEGLTISRYREMKNAGLCPDLL